MDLLLRIVFDVMMAGVGLVLLCFIAVLILFKRPSKESSDPAARNAIQERGKSVIFSLSVMIIFLLVMFVLVLLAANFDVGSPLANIFGFILVFVPGSILTKDLTPRWTARWKEFRERRLRIHWR